MSKYSISLCCLASRMWFFVGSQGFSQVHVVAVAAQALAVIRFDFDGTFFHFFKNAEVGEDHKQMKN